jgi:3-methyl-2-oxobutanoate hydroxymethyltransferase
MKNAVKALQVGADAVKIEGGAFRASLVKRMVDNGIPVVTHIGLTPQSVNQFGGFKKQGKTRDAADQVLADAKAVEEAGAFAVTLECIPADLAAQITAAVKIPTIGIGAGPVCDAQWLVMHDLLGLNEKVPSFVRRYADLAGVVRSTFAKYVDDVASGVFPV